MADLLGICGHCGNEVASDDPHITFRTFVTKTRAFMHSSCATPSEIRVAARQAQKDTAATPDAPGPRDGES